MNHELRRDRADARGVRDILCTFIGEAADSLGGKRVSDADVHSARKAVKRARAALRLMRDALPPAVYQRENAALRDASRPLGAARDARVLVDSVGRLGKLYGPAAHHSVSPAFGRILARECDQIQRGDTRASREAILAVDKRMAARRIEPGGWKGIGSGLERTYRQGRNARRRAQAAPTPECLHEWRKRTKYLWHQLQILEPLAPGRIGELADQAHKLSDYLGDDHDLAVLRDKVIAHASAFGSSGNGALLALIDRCQTRLREKAFLLGARLYEDKPRQFTGRFETRWRRWRHARGGIKAS
jgi:CHAD domain-containing protein